LKASQSGLPKHKGESELDKKKTLNEEERDDLRKLNEYLNRTRREPRRLERHSVADLIKFDESESESESEKAKAPSKKNATPRNKR